jgi:CheY-like chemotaxis protein
MTGTGNAMLALIVEDDTGLRLIYRRVLESINFSVLEAPDGLVAMNLLETQTPDIVFLDMLLPNVNGVTVLNHIINTPRLQNIHTVIVSSNKQFEKMLRPDLPISFVLKPIRPAQIREFALAAVG